MELKQAKELLLRLVSRGRANRAREVSGLATDFRLLAENSSDVIIQLGPDMRARYVSPSSSRILGWSPEEMIGKGPEAFFPPEALAEIAASTAKLLAGTEEGNGLALHMPRKDGTKVWVEGKARLVRDPATGAPSDMVVSLRDITERKGLEDQLAALAMTDGLTGLANRRAFDDALHREWRGTVAAMGQLSLLLLDIDRFKSFNDRYGHQVGDDCLRAVATAAAKSVGQPDSLTARYGGEELAVILPDTDASGASEAAERIRLGVERLRIPHAASPEYGCVTVSAGAATALSRDGGSMSMPEGLIAAADAALYRAKRGGRNHVESGIVLAASAASAAG